MSEIKLRLAAAEEELRFKLWVRYERLLENLSEEELEEITDKEAFSPRLEPPPGASQLDNLDRATLIKLWKQSEQSWRGRNGKDLKFYRRHGHWREQACAHDCSGRKPDSV